MGRNHSKCYNRLMVAATAGYVLVGGRSLRFGSDKALMDWQGRPLCLWIAEQVRAAAGAVTLVGAPERYGALGLPVIADQLAGAGPLAGLAAALEHSQSDWNLVTACDMPYLRADFLAFLLQEAAVSRGVDVLLPIDREGRDEPLCAVYSRRCRAAIAEALRQGIRKMTHAFGPLQVRRIPAASFDPDGRLFTNWNTPSEVATHG